MSWTRFRHLIQSGSPENVPEALTSQVTFSMGSAMSLSRYPIAPLGGNRHLLGLKEPVLCKLAQLTPSS